MELSRDGQEGIGKESYVSRPPWTRIISMVAYSTTRLITRVFSTLSPEATLIPAPTTPAPQAWKKANITVVAALSAKIEIGKPAEAGAEPR